MSNSFQEFLKEEREAGRAEGRIEGIAEGIAEGRAEGRAEARKEAIEEGKILILFDLVTDGILTIARAAKEANLPEEEFLEKAKKIKAEQ
jgi:flagellar biosynthesis/type III secretory pathway protein FliH